MAITSVTYARIGDVTRVFATSDLGAGAIFVWYLDGAYLSKTSAAYHDFQLAPDDQARVDVLDTTDPDFDAIANAPVAYPARRSLWWVRSPETDVAYYVVTQQEGAGPIVTVARVLQTAEAWALGWLSDRLDDLSTFTWTVTPYDLAGNAGTSKAFVEKVVRRPDAPNFSIAFNSPATTVTIASAS